MENEEAIFEYNAAYNKVFDMRTNFDDDGADAFFDLNIKIKEEVMSPMREPEPALDETFSMWSNESGDHGLGESVSSQVMSCESLPTFPRRRSTSESYTLTEKVSDSDPSVSVKDGLEDINHAMEGLQVASAKTPLRKSVKFDGLPLLLPREKEHPMTTRQDAEQRTPKLDLRSRSITRSADDIVNIRDEPFENRKRKLSPPQVHQPPRQKFMSLAEAIRHFQTDTPDRFRSKPRGNCNAVQHSRRTVHTNLTIPHSPALQSQLRSRPVHHLTREEEEALEFEECQKKKIKALPLNKKVFTAPMLGKRIEVRPPTKIVPFNLTEIKKKDNLTEETFKFTARPVPKHILERPTGIAAKQPAKLTDPQTPAFIHRTKTTARVAPVIDANSENLTTKDVFHFGVNFKRGTPRQGVRRAPADQLCHKTVVQPFSFEERDKMMMQKKQELIQKYLEEEKRAREFHANPLPGNLARKTSVSSDDGVTGVLPSRKTLSTLLNDGYAAKREERIKKQLEEEAAKLKRDAMFKARPAVVLKQKPFMVKRCSTPLKELPAFELYTERRAKERNTFDAKLKEKEEEFEELRKQRKLLKEMEEKKEIAKLRQQIVHKAKPAPHMPTFMVQPSNKPLTTPRSPRFTCHMSPDNSETYISLTSSSLDMTE